jgi:signal transduction histidine kinase
MQAYFLETSQEFWENQVLRCTYDFPSLAWNPAVFPDVKRHLLLIFKEAQTNASRHANATEVRILLTLIDPTTYRLEIEDNGSGFMPDAAEHFSNGLNGMKKRAKSIGAQLEIRSSPGAGCLISIEGTV